MEFVHGGDVYSLRESFSGEILDFSANINPLGMPRGVRDAAARAVEEGHFYPDPACRSLTAAIARKEGVGSGQVICAGGAADLIFRAALFRKPRRALLLSPSFSEYESALSLAGSKIGFEVLKEENGFRLTGAFLKKLVPGVDMVFLCDPNNPTGETIEPGLLSNIMDRCEKLGIFLVLDRCFADFLDEKETNVLFRRGCGWGTGFAPTRTRSEAF